MQIFESGERSNESLPVTPKTKLQAGSEKPRSYIRSGTPIPSNESPVLSTEALTPARAIDTYRY